jgi:hypothetical protein
VPADDEDRSSPGAISLVSCAVCHAETAAWVHHLDPELSRFRVFTKGHVWGSPALVGEQCEVLLRRGDLEALVARHPRRWELTPEGVDESIRNGLVALLRGDLGSVPMREWVPGGVVEAASDGFVPLVDLTGDLAMAAGWPDAHRRDVPASRPGFGEFSEDGIYWMVRSPWPSIEIHEVIRLLWQWVEQRHPFRSGRVTPEMEEALQAAGREFLRLDQAAVQRFAEQHPPR